MQDTRTRRSFNPRGFSRRIGREIRRSVVALWIEALAAALWPVFALFCLLTAFAAAGGFEGMAPGLHWVLLGLSAIGLVGTLAYGFRDFHMPGRSGAIRRLDDEAEIRPLSVLSDRLAVGTETDVAARLWQEHQRRAARAADRLAARPPDLRLSRRDRTALRLVAPVLLLGALIGSGGDADRILLAFQPGKAAPGLDRLAVAEPGIEVWAVPPVYTRAETLFLSRDFLHGGTVELPQGSAITIRATGMAAAPEVTAEVFGDTVVEMTALGGGLFEAAGTVGSSGRLALGDPEDPTMSWNIAMIADTPPEISMPEPPRQSVTRALEVSFVAEDDYGIAAAWVEISLADETENRMEIDPIEFGLPLPINGDPRFVNDQVAQDLTEHPWAGAEVILVMKAEDGAGQVAETEPHRFRLPERRFTDPLARSLAEQRRELITDYDRADRVLDVTQSVSRRPEEVYGPHVGAYLAVKLALRRLAHAIAGETVSDAAPDVAEFLWRAALSIEEGDLASALEKLRQAEERLRQALESGTEQEIREAIEDLRQAMNEYLQEMMRQALQNPEMLQQQPMDPNAQSLTQQDLEQMLDQLQRQAESGLRDQARDMLNQLSQMLQNLQQGRMQAGQSPGQQALQELQELIERQRQLSDQTFDELRQQRRQGQQQGQNQGQGQMGQQGQQGQSGQQPGPGREGRGRADGQGRHGENGRLAAEQEALRQAIEELRNQLGGEGMDGASRSLGEAGQSMGQARDDLQGNSNSDAIQDQMDALDRMQEGAEALAEAIQQGQGDQAARGDRNGEGRGEDRESIDPFDRPAGSYGAIDGSSTDVPNQALIDRARELLEELRRRSADQERPDLELRYFERLLERF